MEAERTSRGLRGRERGQRGLKSGKSQRGFLLWLFLLLLNLLNLLFWVILCPLSGHLQHGCLFVCYRGASHHTHANHSSAFSSADARGRHRQQAKKAYFNNRCGNARSHTWWIAFVTRIRAITIRFINEGLVPVKECACERFMECRLS